MQPQHYRKSSHRRIRESVYPDDLRTICQSIRMNAESLSEIRERYGSRAFKWPHASNEPTSFGALLKLFGYSNIIKHIEKSTMLVRYCQHLASFHSFRCQQMRKAHYPKHQFRNSAGKDSSANPKEPPLSSTLRYHVPRVLYVLVRIRCHAGRTQHIRV